MSEAYDRIKEGLNEALAFARGEKTGADVHDFDVSKLSATATRSKKRTRQKRAK